MRKKIRLAQNKDDFHDLGSDDILSRLSDDILVSILSYLPLKYAAVTSMLSRRWRHLWCQSVCLDFEDNERWNMIRTQHTAERNEYINWVNLVICQHKSPNVEVFKIGFDLDKSAKGAISKWIEFAISKNVQRLELDLRYRFGFRRNGNYVFPNKIFDGKCKSLSKRSSFDVAVSTVMEIKFLKALILKRVDVNDEGLQKILSNSPVLEHLVIDRSYKLVKTKIHGKGLALKNLEISYCYGLESIEICDSSIVSFNYSGFFKDSPISFRLNNLQKLEKISITDYGMEINHMFSQIFCSIPNLQVLDLGFCCPQEEMQFFMFPKLPKLKQLKVEVGGLDEGSPSVLTSLVEACPNLQRFTVQMSWKLSAFGFINRQATKQPHQHLEVVEIDGYNGLIGDLELAMYFIENSVALKKLLIKAYVEEAGFEANEITERKNGGTRYRAQQQLEPKIPVGVELVIL